MNDLFDQAVLSTACRHLPGLTVRALPVCNSTNDLAKQWLLAGGEGCALFAAAAQTAGRGRRGRSFWSPDGSGVYFTVARSGVSAPPVGLTCAAAVAVMRAIRTETGKQCDVKWVNDLLLGGRKVCGILCEAVTAGDVRGMVIGVGVNLRPAAFPPELAAVAGSLDDLSTPRADLVAEATRQLLPVLRDPAAIDWLDDYRAHSCVIGREITFSRGGETVPATAVGINEAGELTVLTALGTETLRTGEITLRLR